MIIGIDSLNEEQKELMFRVNDLHTKCVGNDYKEGMEIVRTWINDNGTVCVRLLNGEWFHYWTNGTWG